MVETQQQESRRALERLLKNLDHAQVVAERLAAQGRLLQAIEILFAILRCDPRRTTVRHRYVALYYAAFQADLPLGSLERGRRLLYLLGFNTEVSEVEEAYFDNLDRLLSQRRRQSKPGRLVLGLGCGRCGSTSLAALMAGAMGACATHENPVVLSWPPRPAQIAFHERRFESLLRTSPLVFDAAHWWLNVHETMVSRFPDAKLIGLVREPEACARSFLAIKGLGYRSINHWIDHDGSFWKRTLWDEVYPSYHVKLPAGRVPAVASMEDLQRRLVRQYVDDYNAALGQLDRRLGERMLLVRTEQLSERRTQDEIQDFLGLDLPYLDQVANRGTVKDGMDNALRF